MGARVCVEFGCEDSMILDIRPTERFAPLQVCATSRRRRSRGVCRSEGGSASNRETPHTLKRRRANSRRVTGNNNTDRTPGHADRAPIRLRQHTIHVKCLIECPGEGVYQVKKPNSTSQLIMIDTRGMHERPASVGDPLDLHSGAFP